MFYDKKVKLYKKGNVVVNDYGVVDRGEDIFICDMKVDLQPYSRELLKRDYGIDEICSKRIFCDFNDNVKSNRVVVYKDRKYSIVALVEWDDYMDVILNEY